MLARWRTLAAPPHYREETDWITAIHSEKGQARILLIGDSVMRHLWRPLASELQEDIDLFSSTLIPGDPDYLPTLAGYFPSAGYEAVIVSFGSHVTNKVSAISVDDFQKLHGIRLPAQQALPFPHPGNQYVHHGWAGRHAE